MLYVRVYVCRLDVWIDGRPRLVYTLTLWWVGYVRAGRVAEAVFLSA
jgi:hypothetical protein